VPVPRGQRCGRQGQLLCILRDARKKLAHRGERSFSGKVARKEVAAEAELKARGMDIPPEG
jgi:hypothetical protein